ncbi:hypothetical protein TNCV_2514311 [Trichonephila clavipes]|nr:hypothetical protein TNCV_2514311 [Trichonephila clavipes]
MYPMKKKRCESTDFTSSQSGFAPHRDAGVSGVYVMPLPTPDPKDRSAQGVRKSSPAQPSNASRRHPNKQDEICVCSMAKDNIQLLLSKKPLGLKAD